MNAVGSNNPFTYNLETLPYSHKGPKWGSWLHKNRQFWSPEKLKSLKYMEENPLWLAWHKTYERALSDDDRSP